MYVAFGGQGKVYWNSSTRQSEQVLCTRVVTTWADFLLLLLLLSFTLFLLLLLNSVAVSPSLPPVAKMGMGRRKKKRLN